MDRCIIFDDSKLRITGLLAISRAFMTFGQTHNLTNAPRSCEGVNSAGEVMIPEFVSVGHFEVG